MTCEMKCVPVCMRMSLVSCNLFLYTRVYMTCEL